MVTTAKAGVQPGDIPLTDHGKAGLPEDCGIRVPRLTTLSDLQVSHRRGSIGAKELTSSGQPRRLRLRRNNVEEFRESGTDVPVGTVA